MGVVISSLFFRQQIVDQVTVWQHPASSEIVAISKRAGLNDTGTFYLAASQTAIVDKTQFNKACSSLINEKTVILGCYEPSTKRIYVYNVADQRLDGVREATAAHEMLHAAYDRLLPYEKQHIDDLLTAEEAKLTDQRIKDLIAAYKQAEPTEIINELHSIFGTEVASLSPELERYYGRYFSDRAAVVALKNKYEQVFTDLEEKQKSLVTQLNGLAPSLEKRIDQYQDDLDQYGKDADAFNTWSRSSSVNADEFYSRRAVLVSRAGELESDRQAINDDIDAYNTLKKELDSLNLQAQDLNSSIDSKLVSSPSSL